MSTLPGPLTQARDGRWQVADHGAQVLAWQPADAAHPVIWTDPDHPVSHPGVLEGGIPVCAPWFGHGPDGTLDPQHGPARTLDFTRVSSSTTDGLEVVLALPAADDPARDRVAVRHEVHLTDDALDLRLTLTNEGAEPVTVEAMWHSYFRVGDAARSRVEGVAGASWWNTVDDTRGVFDEDIMPIVPGTDTVVQDADPSHVDDLAADPGDAGAPGRARTVALVDPAWGRRIDLATEGCPTVVVWNPYRGVMPADPSPALAAWRDFVCVETGYAKEHALTLAPGTSVTTRTRITVAPEEQR